MKLNQILLCCIVRVAFVVWHLLCCICCVAFAVSYLLLHLLWQIRLARLQICSALHGIWKLLDGCKIIPRVLGMIRSYFWEIDCLLIWGHISNYLAFGRPQRWNWSGWRANSTRRNRSCRRVRLLVFRLLVCWMGSVRGGTNWLKQVSGLRISRIEIAPREGCIVSGGLAGSGRVYWTSWASLDETIKYAYKCNVKELIFVSYETICLIILASNA